MIYSGGDNKFLVKLYDCVWDVTENIVLSDWDKTNTAGIQYTLLDKQM